MAGQERPLFTSESLMPEISRILTADEDPLSIAYVGPLLEGGRMDAILLADGLKGYGRFVKRVSEMHLGALGKELSLEVQGEPHAGSLEVFVRLQEIGDSKLLQGLAVLAALTGLSAKDIGKSLLATFKKRKGRPFKNADDLEALPTQIPIPANEFIRLFNDVEIRAYLRASLRPLREDGIERFETRSRYIAIDSISKQDLLAADAAELEAIEANEEKTLDIEKVSFFPHLAWHLSDDGKPFDAKIEDDAFWKQISAGDRFGYGDRLRVNLHTETEREANGRLRLTRTVTKVHRIDQASGQQIDLL